VLGATATSRRGVRFQPPADRDRTPAKARDRQDRHRRLSEGHPRIPTEVLAQALSAKLAAAKAAGLEVGLVSQFCFDAKAIVAFARRLRAHGVSQPFRVGVAARPSARPWSNTP